ncbi:hypothetical protein ACTXT7_007900 [Hymenolepis weldensis]
MSSQQLCDSEEGTETKAQYFGQLLKLVPCTFFPKPFKMVKLRSVLASFAFKVQRYVSYKTSSADARFTCSLSFLVLLGLFSPFSRLSFEFSLPLHSIICFSLYLMDLWYCGCLGAAKSSNNLLVFIT